MDLLEQMRYEGDGGLIMPGKASGDYTVVPPRRTAEDEQQTQAEIDELDRRLAETDDPLLEMLGAIDASVDTQEVHILGRLGDVSIIGYEALSVPPEVVGPSVQLDEAAVPPPEQPPEQL